MRAFSLGKDKKEGQWGVCTWDPNMLRASFARVLLSIVMLLISLGSGCGNGGDGGNSDGHTSGRFSGNNTVSDVQGEIDPKWPSDKLPKSVLPIAGAKVLSSMQDGNDFGVVFMCKRKTIDSYIQQLVQIGWNIDKDMGSDGNDEPETISRFFSNDEGEHLQVYWEAAGGSGTLGYSKK